MFTAPRRMIVLASMTVGSCSLGTAIGCSNQGVDAVVTGRGGGSGSFDTVGIGGSSDRSLGLGGAATSSTPRATTGGTNAGGGGSSASGGMRSGLNTNVASPASGGTPSVPAELATTCPGVCNAVEPSNPWFTGSVALGNVTMYTTEASDGGACNYGKTGVLYFAAINVSESAGDGKGQWQEGRFCGQCVAVTVITTEGPKQVVVRIMDRCADEYCGVDLGGEAPGAIMADGFGRYDGAWRLVSCSGHPEVFDGVPSLFVKEGSNSFWSAIQVRNPAAAVAGIDWANQADTSKSGSFNYGSPSLENYYFVSQEVLQGKGTYLVTVKYSDGATAETVVTSEQLAQPLALYPLED